MSDVDVGLFVGGLELRRCYREPSGPCDVNVCFGICQASDADSQSFWKITVLAMS